MKKIVTLALVFGCGVAMAQKSDNVGIGTKQPDPSALLDLNSTTKGLLLPRMSEAQRDAIEKPAVGLMVFQTDKSIGVYTFDGTTWQSSTARVSSAATLGNWNLQGNSVDGTDFIGTTNAEPLRFKVNGANAGFLGTGSTFLGVSTPSSAAVSGSSNTGFGLSVLSSLTSGTNNTAVGTNSQRLTTAATNTSVGSASLYSNTGGGANTAVGSAAMFSNVDGFGNVGVGVDALRANVGGFYNMAIGYASLYTNIAGSDNMGIGTEALRFATGSRNTAVGTWAGRGTAPYGGSNNVFIGYAAGSNEIGDNKLYIANSGTTTPLIGGVLRTII